MYVCGCVCVCLCACVCVFLLLYWCIGGLPRRIITSGVNTYWHLNLSQLCRTWTLLLNICTDIFYPWSVFNRCSLLAETRVFNILIACFLVLVYRLQLVYLKKSIYTGSYSPSCLVWCTVVTMFSLVIIKEAGSILLPNNKLWVSVRYDIITVHLNKDAHSNTRAFQYQSEALTHGISHDSEHISQETIISDIHTYTSVHICASILVRSYIKSAVY